MDGVARQTQTPEEPPMIKSLILTAVIAATGIGSYAAGSGTLPILDTPAAVSTPATAGALPTVAAITPVTACGPQGTPDVPAALASQAGLVNLNTATDAELDKLPTIGKARIKHITDARPIKAIDDLAGPGMPADVIAMLKQRATV